MAVLLFLPEAQEDMRAIWRYLVDTASIEVAETVLDRIHAACRRYTSQPELGERRPELSSDVRCFPVGQLVVFYEPTQDGIHVVQVIHGARNLAIHFRKHRDR